MKHVIKIIGILFIAAFLLPACMDDYDSSGSGDTVYMGYATVDKSNAGSIDPLLVLDDGRALEIVGYQDIEAQGIKELKDQSRAFIYFRRADITASSDKLYPILLSAYEEVLTKKPAYNSAVKEETVGNNPINVEKFGFGGRFMNITFHFFTDDSYVARKHLLNLYVIEDHPDADENNIYVELRHNAYDIAPLYKTWGRVSFDVREFLPEGKNSIMVNFSYRNYDGKQIAVSKTYTREVSSSDSYSLPAF